MKETLKRRQIQALILIVLLGVSIRLYFAPYSTGSDIPQFYGFAGTMLKHPTDFYSYASGKVWKEENWPYNWPYVYGPVLAYLLAILRSLAGGSVKFFWDSNGYHVFVSRSWIIAVKSLFIAADVGIALLLYLLVRKRSETGALLVSALYLLNPMVIYVSSIYGMFDGLAVLPFLTGLYFIDGGRKRSGYALVGFSLAVKHTLLFPALLVLWDSYLRRDDLKSVLSSAGYTALGFFLPFLPFLSNPGSLLEIPKLFTGLKPGYTYPIAYNLNGIVALLTFIHDKTGLDTTFYMKRWFLFAVLFLGIVLFTHWKVRNLRLGVALAYVAFLLTYWRVNTQYILPLVAFLLLAVPEVNWSGRIALSIPAIPPSIWPIMFPTSFWFHVHIETPNWGMVKLVDRLTLMVFGDAYYILLSCVFTLFLLVAIIWFTSAASTCPERVITNER